MNQPSAKEVAERVLALVSVSNATQQEPPIDIQHWFSVHELSPAYSPNEQEFISSKRWLTRNRSLNGFLEQCAILLWALGKRESLQSQTLVSWEEAGISEVILRDPLTFVRESKLRPRLELSEAQGNIEGLLWALRAGPAGRELFDHPEPPADIDSEVILYRLQAINWIMGYGEDWDHTSLDT